MHRAAMRGALAVAVIAAMSLSACSSKSNSGGSQTTSSPATTAASGSGTGSASGSATGSASGSATGSASGSATGSASGSATSGATSGASGALSIVPDIQIDPNGAEVKATDTSGAANPAGDGKATCSGIELGMAGALTGSNAALGINILDGAKLAIDQHNKANPNCQVKLDQFDTEGDPQKATQVAPTIVSNAKVIGLLGPAFSGETKAVGGIFHQANLLSLTASATNPALTTNGWTNFFRGLGNDNSQGGAVANYMTKVLGLKKVCVIEDDSDYGIGLATVVKKTLGSANDTACNDNVKGAPNGQRDFSATVAKVKGESPDAVYYAGYYAEAAPFVSQLRSGGVNATFVSGDGTNDPQFVQQAGDAAKGALLTCPCGPAPTEFAKQYQAFNGQAPGVYSVDAYDLVTIMLKGIDSGVKDRAGMVNYVKTYSGQGLAKFYKWDSTGELSAANIWVYKVQ